MTITKRFANVLRGVLPARTYREVEMRYGRHEAIRWLKQKGVLDLAVKVATHFEYKVQGGLFRGMRYSHAAVRTRHSTPNLLGTYERQLYPLLHEAAARCDLIVDIGSAEGYFAVGLARLTGKPVVAFEVNGSERRTVKEMAALNEVAHLVTVSEWCTSERLTSLVRGKRALVFCDNDGGEFSLFTPDVVESLRDCDVFIELHGTREENRGLVERFAVKDPIVLEHPKEIAGAELLSFLGEDAARMSTEYRDLQQQWLVARPTNLSALQHLGESLRNPVATTEQASVVVQS